MQASTQQRSSHTRRSLLTVEGSECAVQIRHACIHAQYFIAWLMCENWHCSVQLPVIDTKAMLGVLRGLSSSQS